MRRRKNMELVVSSLAPRCAVWCFLARSPSRSRSKNEEVTLLEDQPMRGRLHAMPLPQLDCGSELMANAGGHADHAGLASGQAVAEGVAIHRGLVQRQP